MNKQQRRIAKALEVLAGAGLDPAWDIYQGTASGYEENIIRDIVTKLVKYGSVSEKQLSFVSGLIQKIGKRDEEALKRAAELEAASPFPVTSERTLVRGEVLATRVQEGQYGPTNKMLVKSIHGWKIWVTNPGGANKGDLITFEAKLQPSRDDIKFGFGSRPSKVVIVQAAEQAPPQPELCRHGNRPEDCNDCMVESDFAYDSARGS